MYKKKPKEEPKPEYKIKNIFWKCEFDDGTVTNDPDLEKASIDYYTERMELHNKYPDHYEKPKMVYQWDIDMKLKAMNAARPSSSKHMKYPPTLVKEFAA